MFFRVIPLKRPVTYTDLRDKIKQLYHLALKMHYTMPSGEVRDIYLLIVVWTCHTFQNNLRMKHEFANYLKESCR